MLSDFLLCLFIIVYKGSPLCDGAPTFIVAILQRVCDNYNSPFYRAIASA